MAWTENDTFAVVADVEANVQRGTFSDSPATVPTLQQVIDFLRSRSMAVQAKLLAAGQTYTVPSGANPFPADGSGSALVQALKELASDTAAAGATASALAASTVSERVDTVPEKVAYWESQFDAGIMLIAELAGTGEVPPPGSRGFVDGDDEPTIPDTAW